MKKIFLKRICSAVALSAVAASAVTMTSFAAIDASPYLEQSRNGFSQTEIDASEIKPVVTVTNEILPLDYAKANKTRKVVISVSGANLKYASSGLHIYYDTRLTLNSTPIGTPAVEQGAATKYLTVDVPTLDPTASEQGLSGVFVCSAAKEDYGQDGSMWELEFTLPDDMKEGDAFPIDIFYKSVPAAEDLFTNAKDDNTGKLMQAYFFTKGINNGITASYNAADETFVDENGASVSGTDAVAKCAGLASVDPSSDGVIAIAGAPVTTTTTAPATTTTTKAPTTTTTAPATTTTKAPATTTSTSEPAVTTSTSTGSTPGPIVVSTSSDVSTVSTASGASTSASASTSKTSAVSTAATTGSSSSTDSPKTGVAGVGVAVAGLAVAVGTAFVLRKKED